jgi:hypothetical protein
MTHVTGNAVHRAYDRDDCFDDRMECLTVWAAFVTGQQVSSKMPVKAAQRRAGKAPQRGASLAA